MSAKKKKKKKRKAEWIQRAEYFLYRSVARRAGTSSAESVARWGGRLGSFARKLPRSRDRPALRNPTPAFPERSEPELRQILDECWRHFGRATVGYIRMQQMPPEDAIRDVTFVNLEVLEEARKLDRGMVVISAHYGSWEVAAL